MVIRHVLAFAVLAGLAGCGGDVSEDASTAATACPGGAVTIRDARLAPTRPGQKVAAAYLAICNGLGEDDALVGVDWPGASAVEIHLSEMEDGVMSMRPIDRLPLPVGEEAVLAPGGAHLMLIGLNSEVAEGDAATMTMRFENAEPLTVSFKANPADDAHAH
ncbi:MAG: copper chaperone PCu(A)C [Pseudomonadota bacterium]